MLRKSNRRKSESGFSLVELLIASIVLTVGMLAIMGIFALAIGNNGRSKVDSTATMVAQAVLEQISAVKAGGGPSSLTDCSGNPAMTINPAAGVLAGGNGAPKYWDTVANLWKIDFTQPPPPPTDNYSMNYVVCVSGSNAPVTYDVRWNIEQVGNYSSLIVVGARPLNTGNNRFSFRLPVNLQLTIAGQ
jgi:type II secretory pathway pseudopilin PulG